MFDVTLEKIHKRPPHTAFNLEEKKITRHTPYAVSTTPEAGVKTGQVVKRGRVRLIIFTVVSPSFIYAVALLGHGRT